MKFRRFSQNRYLLGNILLVSFVGALFAVSAAFAVSEEVDLEAMREQLSTNTKAEKPAKDNFVLVDGEETLTEEQLKAAEAALMGKLLGEKPAPAAQEKTPPRRTAEKKNSPSDQDRARANLDPPKILSAPSETKKEKSKKIVKSNTKKSSSQGNLNKQVANQSASIASLKKTGSKLRTKLSSTEARVAELITELEEARNRLMVAETEVERLSAIIERRNKQALRKYEPATSKAATPPSRTKVSTSSQRRSGTAGPSTPVATVVSNKANLRTGPGLNNSPIMTVKRGTRLTVETRRGSWYRVIAPTGERVWVSSDVVSFGKAPDASPSRTVNVKGYNANIEDENLDFLQGSAR